MIVYLATYPRSGNAFLRDLIALNFRFLTANGYDADPPRPAKWRVAEIPDEPLVLAYHPQGLEPRRVLKGRTLSFLDEPTRERFAAEDNLYLVKTHEPPFPRYFEGETAIQMVRHPGAAIVSHWLLKRPVYPKLPLERMIREGPRWGVNWSDYHRSWLDAPISRILRLRYEDVSADQGSGIASLSRFLNKPAAGVEMPLRLAHKRNPERNPGAGDDGWRKYVGADHLRMLEDLHGSTAAAIGGYIISSTVIPV